MRLPCRFLLSWAMTILFLSLTVIHEDRLSAEPAKAAAAVKTVAFPEPTPVGEKTGLIPRKALFDNPDKAGPRISPDGKHLSYLAPVAGVMNVWVAPIETPDKAKAITKDTKRGIRSYNWAHTSDRIIYTQDANGDEDWHVYSTPIDAGATKDLTPGMKISARIEAVSHRFPEEIIIGINDRDPQFHDVYRVNIN